MPLKLSGKEQILVEINEELAYQQRINPLAYHELLPMQEKFKQDIAKTKLLFGGNRSGKSEGVADYVADKALNIPKQRIWIAGETYQDSIAIQQRKIHLLIPQHRIVYGKYDQINGYTNRKILLDNGTLIMFKSYDQGAGAFASDDIDLIWNDEEPPHDIYKEQRMRLIDRDGEMIISMTSVKGITDLVEEIFEDYETIESEYAPLVDETLPRIAQKDSIRIYFLWTPENPHIKQKRILSEAKLLTREEKKSRIYGIPINLSGKIYPAFSRKIHVLKDIYDMPEGYYTLYEVLDPHDRKPFALGWYAVHKTGAVYCVDEWPDRNFNEISYDDNTYDDYKKIIKDKNAYLEDLFGTKVKKRIIDPNFGNKTVKLAIRQGGKSTTTPKKELLARGLFYQDGIDALEAGHLKVREFLHYEVKGDEVVTQPRLYFLSHCQNHIRHLSRYSRKDITTTDGDVKDKVKPKEKYKDFSDLTRYLCMSDPVYIQEKQPKQETKKRY